jgi:hypothetical protein
LSRVGTLIAFSEYYLLATPQIATAGCTTGKTDITVGIPIPKR